MSSTETGKDFDSARCGGRDRPKILVIINAYLPGYKSGGPARSIQHLVAVLGGEFEFRIITSDRDFGDHSPFPGVTPNRWTRVGKADVMYIQPGLRGLQTIWNQLRAVDGNTVLYLNSFFSRAFSMLALLMRWLGLCRPRNAIVAPRGEFLRGSLRLRPLRKRLYIGIFRRLRLHRGLIWHASSAFEAADIARQFDIRGVFNTANDGRNKRVPGEIVVASNIAQVPEDIYGIRRSKRPGSLRVVFISRISRAKNLLGALTLLRHISGDITFDIYGPVVEPKYWRECQFAIRALPSNVRVRYLGAIEHEKVARTLAEHDLLLLPTLSESYGHVICESLASGCPVLIGDQTPWRNLELEGAGWDVPLSDTQRFRSVLQQCVDAGEEWYAELSARARGYFLTRISNEQVISANRQLFRKATA